MARQKKQKQTKSEAISELKGKNTERMDPLIKALVAEFASHNDAVRVKARHSLVAKGKVAVPPLIEALKNKNYLTWLSQNQKGNL